MKERKPIAIEKAKELNTDNKENVIRVYPTAVCLRMVFADNSVHYQISDDETGNVWIGYSTKNQIKAWENAWSVITRKMMRKLEW